MSALTNIFSDIANALRSKMGVSDTYTPAQMAPAINNIPTGAQIDEYMVGEYTNNYGGVAGLVVGNEPQRVVQYNAITEKNVWNVTDASNLFKGNSSNFAGYETMYFGSNVTNMTNTFNQCGKFNSPVVIGNSVTNMSNTFRGCFKFNQPITIPDSVTDMFNTFATCNTLNSPVVIGNSVTNMSNAFWNCANFNQPITIPDSVVNIGYAFYSCSKFNQPITIPDSVTDMSNVFRFCYNFNSPVVIGNSVTKMVYSFAKCEDFNQPITIPESVTNVQSALYNCVKFENDLFFKNSSKILTAMDLFFNCNNSLKKTIYCNNATPFLKTSSYGSIVGDSVTWTQMSDGNGYYNTAFNIYIYNNWTPT